jgi:hypothetical protein
MCWSVYSFRGSLRLDYLHPDTFNQRQVSFSRDNAPEFEPGSLQQVPELRLRPFSTTWCERQHLEIQLSLSDTTTRTEYLWRANHHTFVTINRKETHYNDYDGTTVAIGAALAIVCVAARPETEK